MQYLEDAEEESLEIIDALNNKLDKLKNKKKKKIMIIKN